MHPPSALLREKAPRLLLTGGVAVLTFLGGYLTGKARTQTAQFHEMPQTSLQEASRMPSALSVETPKVSSSEAEYELAFESEAHRSALKTRIDAKIAQAMAAKGSQFEKTLEGFGVSREEASGVMVHAWKVMRASVEVEAMQQQFLKAQRDYDERMRRILSAEDYAKYRFFEESKKLQFEYKSFQKYASKQELPDFSAFESEIQNAIYEAQAYTMSFLHGPYDGMPNVGMGKKVALERLQQDMTRISMSSAKLVETQSAKKLSSECLKALQSYYAACLEHMRAREKKLEADLLQSTAKS